MFRFEFYTRILAYQKWPYLKPEPPFPNPIILGIHVSIFTKVLVKDNKNSFLFENLYFLGNDEPHFDYSNIFSKGLGLVQPPTFEPQDTRKGPGFGTGEH